MTEHEFSDEKILAYLDEMLPAEEMTRVEMSLRNSEPLRQHAVALSKRRDSGFHSVGEIWRRQHLSCPSRSRLGSYVLETLSPAFAEYVEFHLRVVGCRRCTANLEDLEQSLKTKPEAKTRRQKFFQTSAGYLQTTEE